MTEYPPPIGSAWVSESKWLYVVRHTRLAKVAGWHVWVEGRHTPFRKREWESMGMVRAMKDCEPSSEEIIREDRDAWPDHQAVDPITAEKDRES